MACEKLVVKMLYGSHMYGTATPQSDLDYKAVFIPSAKDILMQRAKGSVGVSYPKKLGERNEPGQVDIENFSLQRYLELVSQGQTIGIDMLFAPDSVIIESSPTWDFIRSNKDKLVTKRSAAFVGYCRHQANKYGIKGSRVAASRAAVELFEQEMKSRGATAKVEDIEAELRGLIGDHTDVVEQQVNRDGDRGTFFVCCNRMVNFGASLKHGYEIYKRACDSYGKRALIAESNEGVDWKAMSHAVRVATEAVELLSTGKVTLPLPNAEYVRAVKLAQRPYIEVAESIESLLADVEAAEESSSLPESADHQFIEEFVAGEYCNQVRLLIEESPHAQP